MSKNTDAKLVPYRDAVQSIYHALDVIYDYAGNLRDHATGDEKDYFNQFRGCLPDAARLMRQLDDSLSKGRATDLVPPLPTNE